VRTVVKTFLRGLGVVVPVAFTGWIIVWLVSGAEALLREVFVFVLPERLYSPGLGVVSAIAFVFLIGLLLQFFVFDRFWKWLEGVFDRIPLVKTIYNSARDLFGFMSSNADESASSVVRVSVAPDLQLVGLVTVEDSSKLADFGEGLVSVYFPMSYQLGGYAVMLPRDRVTPLDWTVEEAMRFVLTAGAQRDAQEILREKATEGDHER
jgi:uncharacterized membrane protein